MLPKLDKKTTSPSSSRGQEQDPPGGPGFQFQHLDGETAAHIHTDMHTYMQVCRVPAPAVGSSESSRTRPASEIQEPVVSTVWAGDAGLTFTRGENIPGIFTLYMNLHIALNTVCERERERESVCVCVCKGEAKGQCTRAKWTTERTTSP